MIIRRYLNSQVLGTTVAVAGLLTVILMSGRIIQFFERAASGRISVDLLAAAVWYRMPSFLELILPLGLFMGLLLALGRMYLDNEMSVLAASGVGQRRVLRWLSPSVLLITVATAIMSLWLTAMGYAASAQLYAEQAQRSTFDLIQPGRFQQVGGRMLYADISNDRAQLQDVIMLESKKDAQGVERQIIIQAEAGQRVYDTTLQGQAIELSNGSRWDVRPGDGAYQRMDFQRYRLRYRQADVSGEKVDSPRATATLSLWPQRHNNPIAAAEIGWRWSLVVLVPIVSLLALPLAKVNPRQGRYLKLLPAVVLYLSYVVLLIATRNAVEKGHVGSAVYAVVHGLYLMLALLLFRIGRPRRVPHQALGT
ncbi:lipopolysaccharide export system permease protein [Paraperlucidibaca baekdonensis]|uniref:Lipopolysaccharide export system permease protein LptF n=1 Tax=Paraperlucidibaca baekdonensis TaxID=748120 RepID=A0A3E0H5X8_9GAMM|nr:LPS export ABC transporter permease LptF [Paraperlucidibaca baekdonensis]REH38795.1 lipopolysaccharide export system permease protein [Paraperlucidibaca baekdonensis]